MPELSHVSHPANTTPRRDQAAEATLEPASSNKRKRRTEDDLRDAIPLSKKPFIIRPCPNSQYDKPYTLTPLALLPRARLPLSSLDTTSTMLPTNRLFVSRSGLTLCESDREEGRICTNRLLVARLDSDRRLYAVENVQENVYALCKLAHWVTAESVLQFAASEGQERILQQHPDVHASRKTGSWWESAILKEERPEVTRKSSDHVPRLSMLLTTGGSLQNPSLMRDVPSQPNESKVAGPLQIDQDPNLGTMSPEKTVEGFILQYLEALYLSRTSLAYLAKGPLSKSRAAFVGQDPSMQPCHLVSYFRDMLLTLPMMDKKYKTKLPEILRDTHLGEVSDDEGSVKSVSALLRRAKSKKQLKLSRDGLYAREDQVVKRWWKFHDTTTLFTAGQKVDGVISSRLAGLRQREILAQIILILEIISLEASPSYTPATAHREAEAPGEEDALEPKTKKSKSKKSQDLKLLLDLLLDRLCIWQSVEVDSGPVDTDQKIDISNANSVKANNSDKLKGFCIEVVIPFYMSRIPELAAIVNRKLGGPKAISPPKKQLSKPSADQKKPGAPETRVDLLKKPREPLGRIAASARRQNVTRPPSLVRSATDSAIVPGLKLERSDTPLSAIPFDRPMSGRASVSQYQRFASREVDLTAMSAATAAKRKRKEAIEEQLKQAITTLKKPNRGLAIKEFVDSADQRTQRPGSKVKRMGGNRSVQPVQVTATPKRVRTSKSFTEPQTKETSQMSMYEEEQPQFNASIIPSSATRPPNSAFVPGTVLKSGPSHLFNTARSNTVEETPTRGQAKKISVYPEVDKGLPSTPRQVLQTPVRPKSKGAPLSSSNAMGSPIARSLFQCTERKSISRLPASNAIEWVGLTNDEDHNEKHDSAIFVTPVRKQAVGETKPKMYENTAETKTPATNIYDMLGWNDDDADELGF